MTTAALPDLDSLGLKYEGGKLLVLDQRRLPRQLSWVHCQSPEQMCHIIKTLQVRGAPLIGIAAALALADYGTKGASEEQIRLAAEQLNSARPTAVNLRAAMERLVFKAKDCSPAILCEKAQAMFDEDRQLCEEMASRGAKLINDGDSVLTHCNTGSLVTAGLGTALGAIKKAWRQGKKIHVYVDETRPLLQGARLTAWELEREGIPYTLICDNMAATLMRQGKVNGVFLGADRIALNGDAANKIGTYNAAVCAHFHKVPFYVVAPYTTVDFNCASGDLIPIEEREAAEVRGYCGAPGDQAQSWAPRSAPVWNPAFDVTPVQLITAIVLDSGIYTREQLQQGALSKLNPSP